MRQTDFTSHYVPIKSDRKRSQNERNEIPLHPIMFLLNRIRNRDVR